MSILPRELASQRCTILYKDQEEKFNTLKEDNPQVLKGITLNLLIRRGLDKVLEDLEQEVNK